MQRLSLLLYRLACAVGRPVGGIRPRRIYDFLGRRAFSAPEFIWYRNRWGAELYLSHYYHIDRNILNFGCYDENLHLAIERLVRPGMVCFDVGANLGEMALHMAMRTGPAGVVHAFEPVPAVFERLKNHVERNRLQNIRMHSLALSDRNGTCTIASADATSDNQGLGSIVNTNEIIVPVRQEIQAQTLDDFVSQQHIDRIDLIKIDIQGAEMLLLEGGNQVFTNLSPDILIEISPTDLAQGGFNSRDVCCLIERYGYGIYALKAGAIGRRIIASGVSPNFNATNVFCSKKPV